jgi:ribosomal protein L11 methyltransferase
VFGTGVHPTTRLCLDLLVELVTPEPPSSALDVGTGSGLLGIAALRLGVPRVTAIDVDLGAIHAAAENARLNGVRDRLDLTCGEPDALTGTWPLVLANILAAPLVELAPILVRRVAHRGRLVLSGIPQSVEADVRRAYVRLGMRCAATTARGGWIALVLQASW